MIDAIMKTAVAVLGLFRHVLSNEYYVIPEDVK